MKKLLSILLVVVMVAAMALTVSAAESVTLTVSSTTAEIGDEVTLTVSAKGSFATYGMQMTWDKDALELVGVTNIHTNFMPSHNSDTGFATAMTMSDVAVDGALFSITFKVLKAGTHTVGIAVDNVTKANTDPVTPSVSAGTVTVKAAEPAPCEHKNTEKIPGKAATCTEDGLTEGLKCADCGTIIKAQEVIKATGHKMPEAKAPAAYDCDKGYTVEVVCENGCGHKETVTVEGHKHATVKVTTKTEWVDEEDGTKSLYKWEKDVCSHKDTHGCTYETAEEKILVERPTTGDITPYIAMSVVTLVGLAAAAAYLTLKRKAV